MTNNLRPNGVYYIRDGLYKLVYITPTSAVFVPTCEPQAFIVPITEAETAVLVSENTERLFRRLVDNAQTSSDNATASAWNYQKWRSEIETIAKYVYDTVTDFMYEENAEFTDSDVQDTLESEISLQILESEWIRESDSQQISIGFCISPVDIEPQDIMKYVSNDKRHLWTELLKASFIAHMRYDILTTVKKKMSERYFNKDDDNVSDSGYDED